MSPNRDQPANKSTRTPFDESTMANDSADLEIVESKKQEPRKKQQGRFALIRATASVDSIELEPIGGTYFGNEDNDGNAEVDDSNKETAERNADRGRSQRPWEKDMNTLSPHTWQKRHADEGNDDSKGDSSDASKKQKSSTREDYCEEKKSTLGDEVQSGTLSPNSLSRMAADSIHAVDYDQAVRALEPRKSISYDDERSRGTDDNIPSILPPEFANSLSKGVIHDAPEEASSDVVFGEPATYGAAGGDDVLHEAPAVAERARAIEDWKGGLAEKPKERERNRYFFPDSGRGNQDIFKTPPKAFGFEEVSERGTAEDELPKGARGAAAVLKFWSTTSNDEVDEAQEWKDLDPDIDNYSDTIVEDDSPTRIAETTRLMSTMNFGEHETTETIQGFRRSPTGEDFDPGAVQPGKTGSHQMPSSVVEPDPFSLETFAAINQATPKSKKASDTAFDPFGEAFGDSIDFSNVEPDGLFAPSSASDLSSKKSLPALASSKKDTKPINFSGSARKKPVGPTRAAAPSRTDTGLPKVLGTPPRSPTRRPMNVNQIQDDLDCLAPSRDSHDNSDTVLRAPSGDEFDDSPYRNTNHENEFSPKHGIARSLNDSIWSFDQGLSSYDHQEDPSSIDRYDADVETIDMATLDDSHPCEI